MHKECVICMSPFDSSQPKAKYCCFRCQQEAYRIKSRWREKLTRVISEKTLKCQVCGKEFVTRSISAKYCEECRQKQYKGKQKERNKDYIKRSKRSLTTPPQPEGTVKCTDAIAEKCIYGCKMHSDYTCDYFLQTGHRRGCSPEQCDKFEAVEKKTRKKPFSPFNI